MNSGTMTKDMNAQLPPPPALTDKALADKVLTEEAIEKADNALEKVREMIRSADWANMKATAESALKMPMNSAQKSDAESLYQLADLATYYRTGIAKAVAELNVGNELAVTEAVQVIVVETGPDLLVVRRSARNYTYKFDELPFSLANRLASQQIAAGDTLVAAKAVYEAIAPKTNVDYREESIRLLRGMQGEVEGADPVSVAKQIQQLFPE